MHFKSLYSVLLGKEVCEKMILVLEKSLIYSQKILYEPCFVFYRHIQRHFGQQAGDTEQDLKDVANGDNTKGGVLNETND